ncbi:MAG: TolC family protein, partial [Nevskia sp.]|nr:TolC family protein [Nevskia sp.]
MKKSALLAPLLAVTSLSAAMNAHALTLREAAESALQSDPRLQAADQNVQASAANVDLARAGYLPTVNA